MVKNQQIISHWNKSFHMRDPEFLCKKACGLGPKFHVNFHNKGNINCHMGYFDIQYRKTSKKTQIISLASTNQRLRKLPSTYLFRSEYQCTRQHIRKYTSWQRQYM